MVRQLVKAARPRIVSLDCGYAVDVDGLMLVLKRRGDGWAITVDDGVTIACWRDENDLCHVTIEREREAA
jgi:hypothetical protein